MKHLYFFMVNRIPETAILLYLILCYPFRFSEEGAVDMGYLIDTFVILAVFCCICAVITQRMSAEFIAKSKDVPIISERDLMGDATTIEILRSDSVAMHRELAAKALGRKRDIEDEGVDALVAALDDDHVCVRKAAMDSLDRISPRILNRLYLNKSFDSVGKN